MTMALTDSTNPMQGVSGPGKFAKRTDLEYQSQAYGDGVAYDALKSGAPLANTPDVRGATRTEINSAVAQSAPQDALTPLFAPSQRPNEPITAGVDVGAGPGSEVLTMGKATEKLSDILAKMLPYDTDGSIAVMYQNALARGN
jgi:hypothetical protein